MSSPTDTPAAAVVLRSRPGNVVWGAFPPSAGPALDVEPGTVVQVETLSHQGLLQAASPRDFFAGLGLDPDDVLADAVDVHAAVPQAPGDGMHVCTGPIHVRGARPGDALRVELLGAAPRVAYGINRAAPGAGVLPDLVADEVHRLLVLDDDGRGYELAEGVHTPFRPFPGIVATAPPTDEPVSTRAPGPWGGNLDHRHLRPGTAILLPVFRPGGGLFVGDPHGAQGHGEVNGTAVEHSMTFTIRVDVVPQLALTAPRLETPSSVIVLGLATDLDTALRRAVEAAIEQVRSLATPTPDLPTAYAICSTAVDFGIAEAVNGTVVVDGEVARDLFDGTHAPAP